MYGGRDASQIKEHGCQKADRLETLHSLYIMLTREIVPGGRWGGFCTIGAMGTEGAISLG
jgi:hypothetical protein